MLLLLSPAVGAQTARVVLRWKAIPGVRSYHVQIAREPTFSEVVLDLKVDEPVVKWEALPSTIFYWRVRSFDADGRASEWSAPRQIAPATGAPAPKSPAENATVSCTDAPHELTLETSPVLKEYLLELSPDGRFLAADTRVLHGETATFEVPLGPGTYSWRGRGIDLTGKTTESSPPRKLSVKLAPPRPKPTGDVPAGTAKVALSWAPTACARRYVVEAWHETPEHATLEAPEPGLTFKPAGPGEYRFRVAAKDEKGGQSDWSAESSFRVRLPAPTAAAESVGAQTAAGHDVELSWAAPRDATSYLVEVSASESFKDATERSVTTLLARLTLKPGRYVWRVIARDAAGHPSFPSETRKFVVADSRLPPESVALLFPLADASLDRPTDGLLGLAWSASPMAIGYELEIDGRVATAALSPTRVELSDGAHQVRVRALGANGLPSAWSDAVRFLFGTPRTSTAKVVFDTEPLRCNGRTQTSVVVRLLDARGRRVLGNKPELSVDHGTLGDVREAGDTWVATWRSPAEVPPAQTATLTIKDRDFEARQPLELSADFPSFTLGGSVGGRFNGGAVTSPAGVVSLGWRALRGRGSFTAHLRASLYRAASTAAGPDGPVASEVLAPALTLLAGIHLDLGAWSLRGLGGLGGQLTVARVGAARQTSLVPSLEVATALGRRLGPGALELELSFLFGSLDTVLLKLQAGGLFVGIGYRLDLPGGY